MRVEFSRQIFGKYSSNKFHENPPSGAELLRADGRTDMTKLIVVFRNSANAPKQTDKYTGRNERDFVTM